MSAAPAFDDGDARALRRAVELAVKGRGEVEPNPPVGAVLFRGEETLGEGFHRMYGDSHAEVEALAGVDGVPRDATLAVTLEPCSSTGKKTPPCVAALMRAGVRRVVIGELDPDPRHQGRGIRELEAAGVAVVRAPAGAVPSELLADFRTHLERSRPWVILKWACGLDGRWSVSDGALPTGAGDRWISGESARREVHRLRAHVDAIVVGSGTMLSDDPLLTARPPGPRVPVRVIVDRRGRVREDARVFANVDGAPILWFTAKTGPSMRGVERVAIAGDDVAAWLEELRRRGLSRVLVEGGPTLATALLRAGVVDQAWVFVAAVVQAGEGAARLGVGDLSLAHAVRPRVTNVERCGDDAWFKLAFS